MCFPIVIQYVLNVLYVRGKIRVFSRIFSGYERTEQLFVVKCQYLQLSLNAISVVYFFRFATLTGRNTNKKNYRYT